MTRFIYSYLFVFLFVLKPVFCSESDLSRERLKSRETYQGTIVDFGRPGFINYRDTESPLRDMASFDIPLPDNLTHLKSIHFRYNPAISRSTGLGVGFEVTLPRLQFYDDHVFIQNFDSEGRFEEVPVKYLSDFTDRYQQLPLQSLVSQSQKLYRLVNHEYEYFLVSESSMLMDSTWRLIAMDGRELLFNKEGFLTRIKEKHDVKIDFSWEDGKIVYADHEDWYVMFDYNHKSGQVDLVSILDKELQNRKKFEFKFEDEYLVEVSHSDKEYVLFFAEYVKNSDLRKTNSKFIDRTYSSWGGYLKLYLNNDDHGIFVEKVEQYDRDDQLITTESFEYAYKAANFKWNYELIHHQSDHINPENSQTVKRQFSTIRFAQLVDEHLEVFDDKHKLASESLKKFDYIDTFTSFLNTVTITEQDHTDKFKKPEKKVIKMSGAGGGLVARTLTLTDPIHKEVYTLSMELNKVNHTLVPVRVTRGIGKAPFLDMKYNEDSDVLEILERHHPIFKASYDQYGRVETFRDKNDLTVTNIYTRLYPAPVRQLTGGKVFYDARYDLLGAALLGIKNYRGVHYEYAYFPDGFLKSFIRVLPDESETVFFKADRKNFINDSGFYEHHPEIALKYFGKSIDLSVDSFGQNLSASSTEAPKLAKKFTQITSMGSGHPAFNSFQQDVERSRPDLIGVFPQRNLMGVLPGLLSSMMGRASESQEAVEFNRRSDYDFDDDHGSSWETDCYGYVCKTVSKPVKGSDYSWKQESRTYIKTQDYIERINNCSGMTYCAMGGRVVNTFRENRKPKKSDIFLMSEMDGDDLTMSYVIGKSDTELFSKKFTYNFFNKVASQNAVISRSKFNYDEYERLQSHQLSLMTGKKFTYFYDDEVYLTKIKPTISAIKHDKRGKISGLNFKSGIDLDFTFDKKNFLEKVVYKTRSGKVLFSQDVRRNDQGSVVQIDESSFASGKEISSVYKYDDQNELISPDTEMNYERDKIGQVEYLSKKNSESGLSLQWQDEMLTYLTIEDTPESYQNYYDENETLLASCPSSPGGISPGDRSCFIRYSENSFSYMGFVVHLVKADGIPLAVSFGAEEYPLIVDQRGSVVGMLTPDLKPVWKREYDAWGKKTVTYFDDWNDKSSGTVNRSKSRLFEKLTIWSFARLIENPVCSEQLNKSGYPLYWSKSRVYSPDLREWLTVDPLMKWNPRLLGQSSKNWHPYKYVFNDPMSYSDDSGYIVPILAAALIGGAFNAIISGQKDGQYFKHFAIGAIAGAVGASAFAYAAGSGTVLGGLIKAGGLQATMASAVGGGIAGFAAGFARATASQAVFNNKVDFEASLKAAGEGAMYGAVGGAISYQLTSAVFGEALEAGATSGVGASMTEQATATVIEEATRESTKEISRSFAEELSHQLAQFQISVVSSILTKQIITGKVELSEEFFRDEALSFVQSAMINYFNEKYRTDQRLMRTAEETNKREAIDYYAHYDIVSELHQMIQVIKPPEPGSYESRFPDFGPVRVKNDVRIAKDQDIPSGYQPKDDEKLVIESTNRNKDTVLIKVDAPPKPGLTKVADVGKTDPAYVIARLVDMVKHSGNDSRGELAFHLNKTREQFLELSDDRTPYFSYEDPINAVRVEHLSPYELRLLDVAIENYEALKKVDFGLNHPGKVNDAGIDQTLTQLLEGLAKEGLALGADVYNLSKEGVSEAYQDFCFPEETLILAKTEDGVAHKKISEIKVKDIVISCNTLEQSCEEKEVLKTGKRKVSELVRIKYVLIDSPEDLEEALTGFPESVESRTSFELKSTVDHPFFVNDDFEHTVQAETLQPGDILFALSEASGWSDEIARLLVVDVEIEDLEDPEWVFNISVESNHNYFVSAHSILVHNCNHPAENIAEAIDPMSSHKEAVKSLAMATSSFENSQYFETGGYAIGFLGWEALFYTEMSLTGATAGQYQTLKASGKTAIKFTVRAGQKIFQKVVKKGLPRVETIVKLYQKVIGKLSSKIKSKTRFKVNSGTGGGHGHLPPSKRGGGSNSGAKLTPAQQARVDKVDNIINNHAKPHDFSGVQKELRGEKIPNRKGGYFDHIDEMQKASRGLEKHVNALKDCLKNPNLTQSSREFLSSKLNQAKEVLNKMKDALNGT